MKFKLEANVEFEADDLDDAFKELQYHFLCIQKGHDSKVIIKGKMEVYGIMEDAE